MDDFDEVDATMAAAFSDATMGADGSYAVKNKGEKFKLTGIAVNKEGNPLAGEATKLERRESEDIRAEQLAAIRKQDEAD